MGKFGFNAPDNIIIPTGAGSNVLGCYMAFMELLEAKQILKLPKIFVVQPKNCCPIVACWQDGMGALESLIFTKTIAEGTAIKKPIRLPKILDILKNEGGGLAVTEEEILKATLELSKGVFRRTNMRQRRCWIGEVTNLIGSGETTVVVLTGSGLKSSDFFTENLSYNDRRKAPLNTRAPNPRFSDLKLNSTFEILLDAEFVQKPELPPFLTQCKRRFDRHQKHRLALKRIYPRQVQQELPREPHTVGISFNSSGGSSYRSLSIGSPGYLILYPV